MVRRGRPTREAFAELMHRRVRREFWGYAADEALDTDAIIREEYRAYGPHRATRPARSTPRSAPYGSCSTRKLMRHLADRKLCHVAWRGRKRLLLLPPESHYFGVSDIDRDQAADYADRKGWALEEAEKWLSPNSSTIQKRDTATNLWRCRRPGASPRDRGATRGSND